MNANKNQKNNKDQKAKNRLKNYAQFFGAGFQMLATIGLGVFIGYKLDEKFPNEYKLYTVIFSLVFIGIALYALIKQVSKFSNQNNNDQRDH